MKKKAARLYALLPWALLALCFAGYVTFLALCIDKLVDSDMATEMVYAKMLRDEGVFLSAHWLFSTEIRLMQTQVVFTPLLYLTNNWHVVRVVGSALMIAGLIAAMGYLCSRLKLRRMIPWAGILVLTPFSMEYFNNILRGQYYTMCLIEAVLVVAMCVHWMQTNRRSTGWVLAALICLLSMGLGASGLRAVLTLFMPLGVTAFLLYLLSQYQRGLPRREAGRFLIISAAACISAAVGLLLYVKLITPNYIIGGGRNALFIGGSTEPAFTGLSLARLETLLNDALTVLGWQNGRLFSWALVGNLLAGCLLVLVLAIGVRALRGNPPLPGEHQQLLLLWAVAAAIFGLFHLLVNQDSAPRYHLLVLVYLLPVLLIWFENPIRLPWLNRLMAGALALLMAVNGLHIYGQRATEENWTAQYHHMAEAMLEEGYQEVYATFWYPGNVLTEFTNGQLTVRLWNPVVTELEDFYMIGQDVRLTQTRPEGPFCLVFFDGDRIQHPLRERLNESDIIWQNDHYSVYGYDSYEEFLLLTEA